MNKNAEEDEVRSKKAEVLFDCGGLGRIFENGVFSIVLNKYPKEEENGTYEENEKQKVVRSMRKIYLDRFY